MTPLQPDIKEIIFKTFHGDISVDDFEKWLYETKELENLIPSDIYFELISYNFKQPKARYGLSKIIETLVDFDEYETWKLKQLLTQVNNQSGNYPKAITEFYNLYCKGYSFLDNLAFGYSISLDCPWNEYGVNSFEEITADQQKKLANSFYPGIKIEIARVSNWLDDGKIILLGAQEEQVHRFDYIDLRTEEEKRPTTYQKGDQ